METWTSPKLEEIKMDAEIGSYQEEHDPMRDEPPFLAQAAEESAAE